MADIVSPEVRKRMMSGIRGKDTKPELVLRKGLHRMGYRYRLHDRKLPGKPDIIFPRYRAVIFVNGCFWHRHDCHLFKWPSTRQEFWHKKIHGNAERDIHNRSLLLNMGWRICIVWECALKGKSRMPHEKVIEDCANWLKSDNAFMEVRGVIKS